MSGDGASEGSRQDPVQAQTDAADVPTVSQEGSATQSLGRTQAHPSGNLSSKAGAAAGSLPSHPDYDITAEIARGGMGRVLAGRERALDREVAIKTLLPGANSARFVTEARITAQLPHPGIPPVHTLGTLPDGSPFLAMKLVRGKTLQDVLRARKNPEENLSQLLQDFEQIAQAVGFAHAQGVVHRDLKPANVMVGDFGEVQVMDWGLARFLGQADELGGATTSAHAADSSHTMLGSVIGTPSYMAPEQARGETVDARADVFALGGILAAILTGAPTFSAGSVQETIQQAAAGDTSEVHKRLDRCKADRELVEIARECLQADRASRPANGRAVAEIMANYRAGVEERLQLAQAERAAAAAKEIEQRKRRRVVRIAAAVVFVVLTLGIIGTSIGLVQANTAKEAEQLRAKGEREARIEEAKQKQLAITARNAAQSRLEQLQKGNELLSGIFRDVNVRENNKHKQDLALVLGRQLKQAAEELDEGAIGDPLVVADLQSNLSQSLMAVGFFADALQLNQQALATRQELEDSVTAEALQNKHSIAICLGRLAKYGEAVKLLEEITAEYADEFGPNNPETLDMQTSLIFAYRYNGQVAESIRQGEQTLAALRKVVGDDHRYVVVCETALATAYLDNAQPELAIPLLNNAWENVKEHLGEDNADAIVARADLAMAYRAAGKWNEAIPMMQEAVANFRSLLGESHADTLAAKQNLLVTYLDVGRPDLALPLAEQIVESCQKTLGSDDRFTLEATSDLGQTLGDLGRTDEALTMLQETLEKMIATLGPQDLSTSICQNRLGICLNDSGRADEAIPYLQAALETGRLKQSAEHPSTMMSMNNLAVALRRARRNAEAITTLEEVLRICEANQGKSDPRTLIAMDNLAQSYMEAARVERAVTLFEEAFQLRESTLGRESLGTMTTAHNLAWAYYYLHKTDQAVPLFRESWEFMGKTYGEDHGNSLTTRRSYAVALAAGEQWGECFRVLGEGLDLSRSKLGESHDLTVDFLTTLGQFQLAAGNPAEAEAYLRAGLAARDARLADSWKAFEAKSWLGEALVQQNRNDEAEPLLIEGYEGMKARFSKIARVERARLPSSLDRILDFYAAAGREDEMFRWNAERKAVAALVTGD